MTSDIVVIGGGVAGVSAVQSLRSEGYDGRLFLIGKERELPYDRTSLSKAVLAGDLADPPPLSPADWYDELQVETVLDRTVLQVDVTRKEVLLDGGRSLEVDRVLLATGASARVPSFSGATFLASPPCERWTTRSGCAKTGSQDNGSSSSAEA